MAFEAPFDLTDVDAVKRYGLQPDGSSADDLEIAALIRAISNTIVKWIGWKPELKQRTEVLDVEFPGQRIFHLEALPIVSIDSVQHDLSRNFTLGQTLDPSEFTFEPNDGTLILDISLTPARRVLEVVHTSGVGTTLSAFRSAVPDIERACIIQVKGILERSSSPEGEHSISEMGGSIRRDPLDLFPIVKTMLRPYRRAYLDAS